MSRTSTLDIKFIDKKDFTITPNCTICNKKFGNLKDTR